MAFFTGHGKRPARWCLALLLVLCAPSGGHRSTLKEFHDTPVTLHRDGTSDIAPLTGAALKTVRQMAAA